MSTQGRGKKTPRGNTTSAQDKRRQAVEGARLRPSVVTDTEGQNGGEVFAPTRVTGESTKEGKTQVRVVFATEAKRKDGRNLEGMKKVQKKYSDLIRDEVAGRKGRLNENQNETAVKVLNDHQYFEAVREGIKVWGESLAAWSKERL